jgi:hypothetical protein
MRAEDNYWKKWKYIANKKKWCYNKIEHMFPLRDMGNLEVITGGLK